MELKRINFFINLHIVPLFAVLMCFIGFINGGLENLLGDTIIYIIFGEIFKKWYDEFEGKKVFTILTLFVWKDNSLYEYIVNGKPIANYDITCGDLFTSLEDTHMIIESLEETIKSISAKQKSLIEDGYISTPNDLIYDIWEGILSTQTLSYKSIEGIYRTLKEASEINENDNAN